MNEQRGGGRVVGHAQVASLDDVADHQRLGIAEQLGVDVVADGRDERQQRPGEDARHGERQRDPDERLADEVGADERPDDRARDPERQGPVLHHQADDDAEQAAHDGAGDGALRPPRTGVQVLGRLEQALVDLLERHVQRQRHERQEVVGDAGHHGRRCRQETELLGQDAEAP